MKSLRIALLTRSTLLAAALTLVAGCESTGDGGGSSVSGGVYYGVGVYDPWYYGGYYDDVDVIVTPPDGGSGARPSHPIAPAPRPTPRPTPMPSMPAAPRPAMRR